MAEQETLILTEFERRMVLAERERMSAAEARQKKALEMLELATLYARYLVNTGLTDSMQTFHDGFGYQKEGWHRVHYHVATIMGLAEYGGQG